MTVTNVPGPQFALYMLGRRLRAFYPEVPLVQNTALGIAIMSYDGHLFFGLLGDYDAMPDLDDLAADLSAAIAELAAARPACRRTGAPERRAHGRRLAGRRAALEARADRRARRCRSRSPGWSASDARRSSRDDGALSAAPAGPGELQPTTARATTPRRRQPSGPPPTSGTHRPALRHARRTTLTDDQIIHALELGNVVILYDAPRPAARAAPPPGRGRRPVRRRAGRARARP